MKKYSSTGEHLEETGSDFNNNENSECLHVKKEKYSLRPRTSPKNQGEGLDENTKNSNRQKTVPLSKYRRKTANARERNRMREINQAFQTLRSIIPNEKIEEVGASDKLTKITTLRSAMRYINDLRKALGPVQEEENYCFDINYRDLEFLFESSGDSLSLSENSLLVPDFQSSAFTTLDRFLSKSDGLSSDSFIQTDFEDFDFT